MKIKSLGAVLLFALGSCFYPQTSQAQLAMGEWKTYLAYNSVIQIAQSGEKIYAVSDGALFSVNKNDGEIEFYSKMNGLNDANISNIEFDYLNKQLLIIYNNGNMDFLYSGGVANIPDLYNKQMNTSKSVNHVTFNGDKAYLSCDFGILALNLTKKEIADTYIIGPNATEVKVVNTHIFNNKIYAVTPTAIYTADASSQQLVNYQFWSSLSGLPGSGNFQAVFSFAGKLFLQRNNRLYQLENNVWTAILQSKSVVSWNTSDSKLILSEGTNSFYVFDTNMQMTTVDNLPVAPDIEYDATSNTFWMAAVEYGVLSCKLTSSDPELNYYKPAGPALNIPFSMTFGGNRLFVVPGGRWSNQDKRVGQVMIYDYNSWKNIDAATSVQPFTNSDAYDFMDVAVDPKDSTHFFVSSYGTGLYEFKDDKFHFWHNHTNSTLIPTITSDPLHYTRLDGLVFDGNNNLLVSNTSSSTPVSILKPDGNWMSLRYNEGSKPTMGKIIISSQNPNQKWINSVRYTPGVFIYDDNGTLESQTDDKSVFISRFEDIDIPGTFITPGTFYCMAQDLNGVIWAGTDMGPLLFYNTSRAFQTGYTCSRVKIPRNDGTGLADYLLQNEKIKAIAIDGANRKWIGTETSGVYLMSENGQETLEHFTMSNSPLLSNDIISIVIHPKTGEVFFGTSMGLVSYQSDAAQAADQFDQVYAYPNPVRENYNGIITITGLEAETYVKITDLNGNLIYQTISNGSIATWDGRDLSGDKVTTGIYMVIGANQDGSRGTVAKIMVIH